MLADGGYVDTSPMHSGGTVQDHILTAYGPIFWISMVVWIGVSGLILFAAFKYRRRHDDEEPVQVHGNTRLELAWTVLPFVVLMSLFALTTVEMRYVRTTPVSANGNQALKLCVDGEQFVWKYTYLGTDLSRSCPDRGASVPKAVSFSSSRKGALPGTQANDNNSSVLNPLVIPADTPISMDVTSSDVIHSYYVPTLAGQMNAVPGQVNHMWLDAHPGKYYGQCTELCGEGHAQMLIEVDAVSYSEYNAWYSKKLQAAPK